MHLPAKSTAFFSQLPPLAKNKTKTKQKLKNSKREEKRKTN